MSRAIKKNIELENIGDREIPKLSYQVNFHNCQVRLIATDGATQIDDYIECDNGESATGWITFNSNCIPDFNRNARINWTLYRVDGGADSVDILQFVGRIVNTGAGSVTALTNWSNSAGSITATLADKFVFEEWTIDKDDFAEGGAYVIKLTVNEAGKTIRVYSCALSYYMSADLSHEL